MRDENDVLAWMEERSMLRETARIFREKVMTKELNSHAASQLGFLSGTIDYLSQTEGGSTKEYACPRGHTFKTTSPIVVAVDEDPEYNTGPICSYCYVDWFKANLNANEVTEDY